MFTYIVKQGLRWFVFVMSRVSAFISKDIESNFILGFFLVLHFSWLAYDCLLSSYTWHQWVASGQEAFQGVLEVIATLACIVICWILSDKLRSCQCLRLLKSWSGSLLLLLLLLRWYNFLLWIIIGEFIIVFIRVVIVWVKEALLFYSWIFRLLSVLGNFNLSGSVIVGINHCSSRWWIGNLLFNWLKYSFLILFLECFGFTLIATILVILLEGII